MPKIVKAPLVTGLSPREGSPGTLITIRGENLGKYAKDIFSLRICGIDCTVSIEWHSSNKIVARSGPCKGKGDVILSTLSGGVGSCTVKFKGYLVKVGLCEESAIWVDESKSLPPIGYANYESLSIAIENPLKLSEKNKFPQDELNEIFPEGSSYINLSNFNARKFLLENYCSSSFHDLILGAEKLEEMITHQNDGPYAFIKSNLNTFIECFEALESFYAKLVEVSEGKNLFNALLSNIEHAKKQSKLLFDEVLFNKEKADEMRCAVAVLNRHKFLFNLPLLMQKYVNTREFSLAVTEYKRVKTLYCGSKITLFQKTLNCIEDKVSEMRTILKKQLFTYPSSVDEQHAILKHLNALFPEGEEFEDFAWQSLLKLSSWLTLMLIDCKERHFTAALSTRHQSEDGSAHTNPGNGVHGSHVPSSDWNELIDEYDNFHFLHEYIENLCQLTSSGFSDIWKMGLAYFCGQLTKEVSDFIKRGDDCNKVSHFKYILDDAILLFINLIRSCLIPHTIPHLKAKLCTYGDWKHISYDFSLQSPLSLLNTVKSIAKSCKSILTAESISSSNDIKQNSSIHSDSSHVLSSVAFPTSIKVSLMELMSDIQSFAISSLFAASTQRIKEHIRNETWTLIGEERGYSFTSFCLFFFKDVNLVLKSCCDIIQTCDVSEQVGILPPTPNNRRENKSDVKVLLSTLVKDLLLRFVESFNDVVSPNARDAHSSPQPPKIVTPYSISLNLDPFTSSREILSTNLGKGDDFLKLHTLSNISYALHCSLPDLYMRLTQMNVNSSEVKAEINERIAALSKSLEKAYIFPILNRVGLDVREGISSIDYRLCLPPQNPSVYVMSISSLLCAVMSRVHEVSSSLYPSFSESICTKVVTSLQKILVSELKEDILCREAILQVHLDLMCLKEILQPHMNSACQTNFLHLQSRLPTLSFDAQKSLTQLKSQFIAQNKMLIASFASK